MQAHLIHKLSNFVPSEEVELEWLGYGTMPVDDVVAVATECAVVDAVDAMVAMKIECAAKGKAAPDTSRRFARMTYQLKKLKKYKIRCLKLFDINKLMQGICQICWCLHFVQ